MALPAALLAASLASVQVTASPAISGGIWINYTYVGNDGDPAETADVISDNEGGFIGDEALILYFDDQKEGSPWSMSAEMRYGPGAYTRASENSTGDNFSLHKAWVAYQIDESKQVKVGKSQVPFGWKTYNNWPGDMLLGGYGDQMDVGVKLSGSVSAISYDAAYFHADDWGESSTDTQSDNGHWGSPTTYRKVKTLVANAAYQFAKDQKVGMSLQSGKLQALNDAEGEHPVNGEHSAWVAYYTGQFDQVTVQAEYMGTRRELPEGNLNALGGDEVKNDRAALLLGYTSGDWFWFLDATQASAGTDGNVAGDVTAFSPGVTYNYGQGWIYLEYLTQDGFINRDGMVGEGDYSALYATIDYYF
ncbi:MAG: hypothetical protein CMI09_13945 [Oceanospirillaceae bacterium]|nr:hypothetical protein [Oceanospirillaceae bacterium]